MRILGTFVNFGSASDHLYWNGHLMRTAWRERRRQAAEHDAKAPNTKSDRPGQPITATGTTVAPCGC